MSEARRKVEIQVQRWRPETTTVVVSVPGDWDDAMVKKELTNIYEQVDPGGHDWRDQDDYDPREGDHELVGDADPDVRHDLTYPTEGDDDDEDEG